jgi:hypothetical protein
MKIVSLVSIIHRGAKLFLIANLFCSGCGPLVSSNLRSASVKASDVDDSRFADVIGTQTIGAKYQFTEDSVLVESAKAILAMGSRILKVNLGEVSGEDFEALLEMPFHTYLFWFHGRETWMDGLTADEQDAVYRETYTLASSLKTRFSGKDKVFYIGHWEGDWQLLKGFDGTQEPEPIAVQGMIDWLNTRQRALQAVEKDLPDSDVRIYHYTEVNRVFDAIERQKSRVVNAVLPYTNVDYVSYSSYDAQLRSQTDVNRALDYIEARLKPNPKLPGKRVIVTEFGMSADAYGYDPNLHEQANRTIIAKYLAWGVPMILYWEMYNNEIVAGQHRGFWLIDDKNVKWPLYFTMQRALVDGRRYVRDYVQSEGKLPTKKEYLTWLGAQLNGRP